MKLYALHDKKAQALSSFHAEKSDTVASRGFAEAVRQPNSVFAKYPDDFELVCLAELFEDTSVQTDPVWQPLEGVRFSVVLTARQVVDLEPKADGQLSLLKEA